MKINKIMNVDNITALKKLPFVPLRESILFPGVVKNFYVGRGESIAAIEEAVNAFQRNIFVATQKNPDQNNPELEDLFPVGTIASVLEVIPDPDKKIVKITVKGAAVGRLFSFEGKGQYKLVYFDSLGELKSENPQKVEILKDLILKDLKTYLEFSHRDVVFLKEISRLKSDVEFFHAVLQLFMVDLKIQQEILESNRLDFYFSKLAEILYLNIENINLEKKIALEVRKKLDKNQKEFFLNEQMKEIQKELGNFQDEEDEFLNSKAFSERLDRLGIPDTIKLRLSKEQKRLLKMPPMSQEVAVIKNYIDTFLELPWVSKKEDNRDLLKAKEILDSKHYSLRKVKNRILEYLAVRQLNPNTKGPILCFIGPPGTGKTSLSKSVAEAVGREFIRVSLGGVRDEAEIRGHRKTYLGAMPGKIIQSMKKVESINPVFLLDEIDKMSSDFRGDPASALLEVLDPEQNNQFMDHFLEIPYNLSEVIFICTANSLQGIPYPLLDRMEIIHINSYTEEEKIHISKEFIIPAQKIENGINSIDLQISKKALASIVRNYTMEAGVRALQRQIASICRKTAKNIVLHRDSKIEQVKVTSKNLSRFLGKKKYFEQSLEDFLDIGVSHGLAWSELGGAILPIEIVLYLGKGNIILTGKLGDVMKESAQTAFSFIKSNSHLFHIEFPDFYKDYDLHIHFPEGATPKDGPSAGIAITCGILSALTKTAISSKVAMTGEITLTGKVLPIGGLREKTLAALRHGKKEVILPADNLKDVEELPQNIRSKIDFKPVKHAEDVFHLVFDSSIYKQRV